MGIIWKYTRLSILLAISTLASAQKIAVPLHHDYVDMGLSVNWATCNIGAINPEDYGDYFAWGEIDPKSCYNNLTYLFSGETHVVVKLMHSFDRVNAMMDYTKYLGDRNNMVPDDTKLDIVDDVANVRWGKPWRMPTLKETKELVDSCNWVFEEKNGILGCWAVSKVNGNKIFFPLAGYVEEDELCDVGKSGKYWSSELRKDMCFEAYQIWISYGDDLAISKKKSFVFLSDDGIRENGRSVRAVIEK